MLGAYSGALGIPRDLTVLYLSGTLFTLLLFFFICSSINWVRSGKLLLLLSFLPKQIRKNV